MSTARVDEVDFPNAFVRDLFIISVLTSCSSNIKCVSPFLQTSDSKKEEFRKYLERSGVVDVFTRGTTDLVKLWF